MIYFYLFHLFFICIFINSCIFLYFCFFFPVEDEEAKILTLEPISSANIPPHETVFINDIKLLDLKQILSKHNINSEWSNGVLWSCNNTIAIRKARNFLNLFILV